ncbi:MAG TPA: bifunctional UDP-N-acetylglucosamine diphosphorylase/glucosamine-1-phosphate N-acetyltransferase GlmU [Thermoanaerobaculia bacterium]|nr:bifunctional UDP-N-acetylglucosamine diphosphorylase/glucosamine-1-phosphate N-acetyltransferase GlmU [Thermoanaerobaculia bacterium]
MSDDTIEVVILAAGLGTRMKSSKIKILHRAGGRALIDYVLDLAAAVSNRPPIVVIGHQREAVQQHCGARARYAIQDEQLGTGHALLQAAPLIEETARDVPVLVLSGDVPLTRRETLERLFAMHRDGANAATLVSMIPDDPGRYGRVVRDGSGRVVRIVELKDSSEAEKAIREVNGGIYLFQSRDLFRILRSLSTDNAQGEYYLTDVIAALVRDGRRVEALVVIDPAEAFGVNSRAELAAAEKELMRRHVTQLMDDGVTFRDPDSVLVETTVRIGADTIVYPFAVLEGETTIGRDCEIGPAVHLRNVRIADRGTIRTGTVAEETSIGEDASVGPHAHLRPGTILGARVKIGNFVETKKAIFGDDTKASHLSYIGDAEIGARVNIGAGTITCNYDGVRKHKTILEEDVFIGSDSQLIAPVRVGKGAYVGAGSTITKDVPAGALSLSRMPQKTIEGWADRRRNEK